MMKTRRYLCVLSMIFMETEECNSFPEKGKCLEWQLLQLKNEKAFKFVLSTELKEAWLGFQMGE